MTIVSGAASVAPSIGYLDVQKNDNFTGIDEPSIHSQDSFIYDTTYMTARVKEGCVLENPLHKHGSVEQSDPLYDDYLAIEDLEGTQCHQQKRALIQRNLNHLRKVMLLPRRMLHINLAVSCR